MMRKQADTAARFVHREFDQRSDRAVVGDSGVVATDRRNEHTLTIEDAVNGLDRCSFGLIGVSLARAVKQRQAVDGQALGHTIDVEFRLAPLPSIEHVHDRARDEPELMRFLRKLFDRQRLETRSRQLALNPACIFTTHDERRSLTAAYTAAP